MQERIRVVTRILVIHGHSGQAMTAIQKITVADEAGTELADTKTTRSAAAKDSVTLENITLSEASNVTVNLSPLKKWTATSTAVMCW